MSDSKKINYGPIQSIGFTANLGLGFGNSATANNSETEAKSGGVSRGSSLPFFTSSAPKKAPVPQDVLKLIETEGASMRLFICVFEGIAYLARTYASYMQQIS